MKTIRRSSIAQRRCYIVGLVGLYPAACGCNLTAVFVDLPNGGAASDAVQLNSVERISVRVLEVHEDLFVDHRPFAHLEVLVVPTDPECSRVVAVQKIRRGRFKRRGGSSDPDEGQFVVLNSETNLHFCLFCVILEKNNVTMGHGNVSIPIFRIKPQLTGGILQHSSNTRV